MTGAAPRRPLRHPLLNHLVPLPLEERERFAHVYGIAPLHPDGCYANHANVEIVLALVGDPRRILVSRQAMVLGWERLHVQMVLHWGVKIGLVQPLSHRIYALTPAGLSRFVPGFGYTPPASLTPQPATTNDRDRGGASGSSP